MKKFYIALRVLGCLPACANDENIAINKYLNEYGYENGEKLFVSRVDFDGDGVNEIALSFSKTDFYKESGFYSWAVFQWKDGKWQEPKTLSATGRVLDFSFVNFWPETAGFVTLPKIGKKGILTQFGKPPVWSFSYLENGTLKSMNIEDPADVDSTDEDLTALCEASKIIVEKKDTPAVTSNE